MVMYRGRIKDILGEGWKDAENGEAENSYTSQM